MMTILGGIFFTVTVAAWKTSSYYHSSIGCIDNCLRYESDCTCPQCKVRVEEGNKRLNRLTEQEIHLFCDQGPTQLFIALLLAEVDGREMTSTELFALEWLLQDLH